MVYFDIFATVQVQKEKLAHKVEVSVGPQQD